MVTGLRVYAENVRGRVARARKKKRSKEKKRKEEERAEGVPSGTSCLINESNAIIASLERRAFSAENDAHCAHAGVACVTNPSSRCGLAVQD